MTSQQLEVFNEHRALLFGIAWRMLGNSADAEDAVQEAFVRWQRTPGTEIRSPRAFLVTVVTRLCLNQLDLARVKRELPLGDAIDLENLPAGDVSPAEDVDLADALDTAFSIVLKCLSPMERAVFLLREIFECDYSEVARIVEKSEDNCRQILRRARERIAGRDLRFNVPVEQQERVLREFVNATENGDLDRLARVLAGDVTLVADGNNLGVEPPPAIHGDAAVARVIMDTAGAWKRSGAQLHPVAFGQVPLLLVYRGVMLTSALAFVPRAGQVRTIYAISCPVRLRSLSLQFPAPGQEPAQT